MSILPEVINSCRARHCLFKRLSLEAIEADLAKVEQEILELLKGDAK